MSVSLNASSPYGWSDDEFVRYFAAVQDSDSLPPPGNREIVRYLIDRAVALGIVPQPAGSDLAIDIIDRIRAVCRERLA